MFTIGKMLKEAREEAGVSLEEASNDIQIKAVILENIEEGNTGAFKDIFELKDHIQTYAKYLGLDGRKIMDEFNEYMFEYTSKIPLKEIEKKVMEQNREKEEKVVSPYTKPMKKYPKKYYIVMYFILILIAIVIVVWSVGQIVSTEYYDLKKEDMRWINELS